MSTTGEAQNKKIMHQLEENQSRKARELGISDISKEGQCCNMRTTLFFLKFFKNKTWLVSTQVRVSHTKTLSVSLNIT